MKEDELISESLVQEITQKTTQAYEPGTRALKEQTQPQVHPLPLQNFYELCLAAEYNAFHKHPSSILKHDFRIARGFINGGNTCFRNASIQCILAAPSVAKVLLHLVEALNHPNLVPNEFKYLGEMLKVTWNLYLNKLVVSEISSTKASLNIKCGPPTDLNILLKNITETFRNKMQHQNGNLQVVITPTSKPSADKQEDAMEFITFLLDLLHEEEVKCAQNPNMTEHIKALSNASLSHGVLYAHRHESGDLLHAKDCDRGGGDDDDDDDDDDGEGEWEIVEKASIKKTVDKSSLHRSKKVHGIISRLFHVRLCQTIRYIGKKRVSNTFIAERFINILVSNLPEKACTVQDALDVYFQEISIDPISATDVEKKASFL